MKTQNTDWNLRNVRKIHRECLAEKSQYLLCSASRTFREIWRDDNAKVKQLAEDFLAKKKDPNFYVGNMYLFLFKSYCTTQEERAFRLEFLRHEIKRLKKEEKK